MFFMNVRGNYLKVIKVALLIIILIGFVIYFYNNIFVKFFNVANEKCEDSISTKYKYVVSEYYIKNLSGKKISGITNENLAFYETELQKELKKVNADLDGSIIKVSLGEILQDKDSMINWEIFNGTLTITSLDRCDIKKERVELESGQMQDNLVFYSKVSYKISSGIFSRKYDMNVFFQIN
jgi:hypothetical protein